MKKLILMLIALVATLSMYAQPDNVNYKQVTVTNIRALRNGVNIISPCTFTSTVTMSSTVYNSIVIPAMNLSKAADANKPDTDSATMTYLVPQNDTTEMAGIFVKLPDDWKAGSAIYLYAEWLQASAKKVYWVINYKVAAPGLALTNWSTIGDSTNTQYTYGSGTISQLTQIGTIAPIQHNTMLHLKLYRKDNSLSGDAKLVALVIKYQVDAFGATGLITK